jgi:hypothetical protein
MGICEPHSQNPFSFDLSSNYSNYPSTTSSSGQNNNNNNGGDGNGGSEAKHLDGFDFESLIGQSGDNNNNNGGGSPQDNSGHQSRTGSGGSEQS